MGVRSGYMNLGSLKSDGDHGYLLNATKESLKAMPSQRRAGNIRRRLEIAEVVEELGLSDALLGLFMSNKAELESDKEEGQKALRAGLIALVNQQLAQYRAHREAVALTAVPSPAPPPVQAEPPEAARPLSAAPEKPEGEPAVSSAEEATVPADADTAPSASDQPEPANKPQKGNFALGGLMKMR